MSGSFFLDLQDAGWYACVPSETENRTSEVVPFRSYLNGIWICMTNGLFYVGCLSWDFSWRLLVLVFVRGKLPKAMGRLPVPTELVYSWESSRRLRASGMYVKLPACNGFVERDGPS